MIRKDTVRNRVFFSHPETMYHTHSSQVCCCHDRSQTVTPSHDYWHRYIKKMYVLARCYTLPVMQKIARALPQLHRRQACHRHSCGTTVQGRMQLLESGKTSSTASARVFVSKMERTLFSGGVVRIRLQCLDGPKHGIGPRINHAPQLLP